MGNPLTVYFHFGLLGWPLGHSLSPAIHQSALEATGLHGEYVLYPAQPIPAGARAVNSLIQRFQRGDLQGLNVTIPHKQSVVPLLDSLTGVAQTAGAVNLIYRENGHLVGDNSDAPAFMTDLERITGFGDRAGTVLVLGAGGAARAAVFALLQAGWQVFVASRRVDAARQLAIDLAAQAGRDSQMIAALPLEAASLRNLPACDLVVNATPVGMFPHIHETPWPAEAPYPRHAAFYDMVYNPTETVLTKAARSAGLAAANGLGMLVEQAALSFERWTGQPAPRQVMREAALVSLSQAEATGPV